MTTDHDKLRELAEAARDAKLAYLAIENERAWDALMAAMDALGQAHPEAILALLDRLERAERERDEERSRHAAASHEAHKTVAALSLALDEARAERDARPEITAEDAAASVAWGAPPGRTPYGPEETHVRATRAHEALRAHAAKAKVTR